MSRFFLLAALVLLDEIPAFAGQGWYLMVPPRAPKTEKIEYNFDAPLSRWLIRSSHDTAKECEQALYKGIEYLKSTNRPTTSLDLAHCIASDDPRLK
jgi:hypothetical protein